MSVEELPGDLLRRGWDDPTLQALIQDWPDRPYIDEESIEKAVEHGRMSLFNLEHGLYLFLTDAPSFMARYGIPESEGPIVLARVVCFGAYHPSVERFRGAVIGGLGVESRFDDLVKGLGRPEWTHDIHGTIRKARWCFGRYFVDVSFTINGECRLVSLTPLYSEEAVALHAEAKQRQKGLPAPAQILEALGTPLDDPALADAFRAVEFSSKLHEAISYGEMDFSHDDGFELYASPAEALALRRAIDVSPGTLCLSGARYRGDLDFKRTQWHGDLPFGITFDDGPDTVVAKVGRVADQESFDEMQGSHRWHFGNYDLHVLYSLAEDHVYRVTLLGRKKD